MANEQRYASSDSHQGNADLDDVGAGKRNLTDRIQRKASGTPAPAAPAQPFGPVDPVEGDAALAGEQSFVDSILMEPVQRHGAGAAGETDVHATAAQGVAGRGGSLPFMDQIQASFGAHDVSGVEAHTDGAAASAAAGIGATAYATGNHVAFGGAPDLHTAAHEAAHVVQQRAGVHLKGGVGEDGDAYERHADAVADAVVRGESAEGLLGHAGDTTSPAVQAKAVQAKNGADDMVRDNTGGEHAKKPPAVHGPSVTGDEYADHGGPSATGFLTGDQRSRLVSQFQGRTLDAGHNYQHAAGEVRVDKLLAKEDSDLPWVASLLLDLAFGFVAGKIVSSVLEFRSLNMKRIDGAFSDAMIMQVDDPKLGMRDKAIKLFSKLSDDGVKSAVEKAAGAAKTQAVAGMVKSRGADAADDKTEKLSYLDQLKDAASIGFQAFRESVPAHANDAELVALFDAMDVNHHLISQYKTAISAKLDRFAASGTTKVGRRYENRWWYMDGKKVGGSDSPVVRDVFLRWHDYVSGYPRKLVFHYQDRKRDYAYIEKDEPGNPDRAPGPMIRHFDRPIEAPQLGLSEDPHAPFYVPDEFVEVAAMRHKQMWGADPALELIDDSSFTFDPARVKKATENKQKAAVKATPKPAAPPASVPPPPPAAALPDIFKDVDLRTGKKLPQKDDGDLDADNL